MYLPLRQIHKKKKFSPFQKQFYLTLNKTKQDSHISTIFPHFCHVLTKTTQLEGRQKTYATENKRKQRIKGTQNNSTLQKIETTPPMKSNNFPYEQQGLKTSFSPYKNRKNKTSFEKKSFGENLGGGENKDTQTKLKN